MKRLTLEELKKMAVADAHRRLRKTIERAEERVADAQRKAASDSERIGSMLRWGELQEAAVNESVAKELKGWLSLLTSHPLKPSDPPLEHAQLLKAFTNGATDETARTLVRIASEVNTGPDLELVALARVARELHRVVDLLTPDPADEPKES